MDIFELLKNMLTPVIEFAPSLAMAIAIILIGWMIAKFIAKTLRKVFNKIGIDRLSDYINDMELFGESSFRLSLSAIITGFIYYAFLLIVWVAAADVLGVKAITDLLNDIIGYVPNLLVAFIYMLLGVFLADMARKFVMTTLQSLGIPSANIIAGFIFYFLIVNILLGAMTQAKISTEFIASNISIILGGIVLAFAIGYGLASKDIAGNLISSFYWKDKFDIGDTIEIEGISGRIVAIEKSHLIIESEEGETFIPMNKVSNHSVTIKRNK